MESILEENQLKVVPTIFLIDTEKQIVAQWAGKANHQEVESTF